MVPDAICHMPYAIGRYALKDETLRMEGLHCGHCTALVKNSVELVKGVESADVTLKSVRVRYDEEIATRVDIETAITRFGYKITDR